MKRLCVILLLLKIFIFENCLCQKEAEVMCNYNFSTVNYSNSETASSNKHKSGKASCDKQVLIKGLSHMGVANPEDVGILPSSVKNLDDLCSRIEEALERMVPVAISCATDEEMIYFRTLLIGMIALSSMLCNNNTFRADYKTQENCLNKLYWDLEDCEGPAQWICNKNETFVCDTYRKIQTCVFLKSGVLCGWTGAAIMNVALREATDKMLRKKCKNVRCEPTIPKDIVFATFGSSPLYVADLCTLFGAFISSLFCFINRV
ncbi:uncharacterized protein LOC126355297 [Schistocerca gregaria]|uniref:uncharacterized protein LOC126355297 n=1 Tax=Schistocerca gregaria TaxID=7010 RepID=UPI00211DD31B|nr:uncharacterized protein LOC126355297 [Schistocerca gregaria]